MNPMARKVAQVTGTLVVAAGLLGSPVQAGSRQPVPHGGGGGGHASAPHGGGGGMAVHGTATRGAVPPHGTARGVARWGYGYGYGNSGWGWDGYPYYGWWSPWWGVGWYGAWGWPGYAYGYGPSYLTYDDAYVAEAPPPAPHGPALIETGVTPSKAEVLLDGESVGFAADYNGRWDRLSVAPGHHTITFRASGHRSVVVEFDARPGAHYNFDDTLVSGDGEDRRALAAEPAPPPQAPAAAPAAAPATAATGRLRLHIEPGDAAVYLDGEYLGMGVELARVHGAIAVSTGTHQVEAVRPGFVSAKRTIEVGASELATAELTLAQQP